MSKTNPVLAAAVESRAQTVAPLPRQVIPDGCNLGVLLRVLAGVNAVALPLVLASAPAGRADIGSQLLAVAAALEPVLLLTMIAWCLLRRSLPPLPVATQRALTWLVPAALTLLVLQLVVQPAQPMTSATQAAIVLLALVGGMGVQHYLELRARAFSPAMVEAKFQALQSRIRPHFFFNSLNAVLAVIRADPARAERMLENVAELFRAVMGDVRKLVPLAQELDLCRKYVEIEQTRLGDRLKIDWQIGAVHPRCRVPQLLLQPIIENAVRYGAEEFEGDCLIDVRVRQHGFNLEVLVGNPVAKEPIQREGNQIGLSNIRGRLALLYDLEATLTTRVRRDRFELTLTIPVENRADRSDHERSERAGRSNESRAL